MTTKNEILKRAKDKADDEYYTPLEDISNEMQYYKHLFENKVIYLNCDDPRYSNFWKYFETNFRELKLKKLISTYHSETEQVYRTDYNGKGRPIRYKQQYDGGFRSLEALEALNEADIVITNPPFSLYRDFTNLMHEYNKDYLIIGIHLAVAYKDTFKRIKENKVRLGIHRGSMYFNRPDRTVKPIRVLWYTTLKHGISVNFLKLNEDKKESDFEKYDNCDAINIDKLKDIPANYKGLMGVPVTFLGSYNPEQFKLVRLKTGDDGKKLALNGKIKFIRILIKNKTI